MKLLTYSIPSPYISIIRDVPESDFYLRTNRLKEDHIPRLKFHVESGDYFAMLSTILGIVEERIMKYEKENARKSPQSSKELELLQSLRQDLWYMYENYKIIEK